MKKLNFIITVVSITQILLSCGKSDSAEATPKSMKVEGDFGKNIEISSEKISLKIEKDNGSDRLLTNVELKGILPCPGCTYDYLNITLLDANNEPLGKLKFDRAEGEQIEKLDNLIQSGTGKTMLTFKAGRIGDEINSTEEMQKIVENCKYFSVYAKALKIPTAGELLIGQSKFGGVIVSADKKGEHGLIISMEDLSNEADWSLAKKLCAEYSINGDAGIWRLPSKSEMEQIYANHSSFRDKIKNDLESTYYWTGTVYNHNFGTTWPYSFDFDRGESDHNKGMVNKFHVRAVREF